MPQAHAKKDSRFSSIYQLVRNLAERCSFDDQLGHSLEIFISPSEVAFAESFVTSSMHREYQGCVGKQPSLIALRINPIRTVHHDGLGAFKSQDHDSPSVFIFLPEQRNRMKQRLVFDWLSRSFFVCDVIYLSRTYKLDTKTNRINPFARYEQVSEYPLSAKPHMT